jgi:formylglycine-generating enzyme required for sulfatase activity
MPRSGAMPRSPPEIWLTGTGNPLDSGWPMTTLNRSFGTARTSRGRCRGLLVFASLSLLGFLPSAGAQNSSLGIKMVPVLVPQLQLTAPLGTTNALELSTNLAAWQDIATLIFTSTNLAWVDQYPRGGGAYYRLRRVAGSGGSTPPFPPPLANLVWIPPGQFVMGSPDTDPDFLAEEQPQTIVTLTRGFFIGKYEVTQGEYLIATGSNPSSFTGDTNLPVETVSWTQATNYCRLVNLQESLAGRLPSGYAYRLPTEAEWEYAARAGSTNRFSWGNDPGYTALGNYAWYSANSGGTTHSVGQKLPNAWGLYDVSGNVCEWCQNSFAYYPGGSVTDPPASTTGTSKVFRGGSHGDDNVSCRPADRKSILQSQALNIFGLRVVLAPTAP